MRIPLLAVVSSVAVLGACSTAPTATPASTPVSRTTTTVSPPAARSKPVDNGQSEASRLAALEQQQIAALNGKSVFFGFDDYTIKSTFDPLLEEQAAFLKAHASDHVLLQGNSDERGSSEYNLALGQKRAEAVRKALTLLGVGAERMEATSFGKEKPRASCHEESCWSQNRRVDFVHADKP